MKVKQIIAFFILLLLAASILVVKSTPVSARNYAVQLKDEQDVENDCDLKTISMKDDFDNLYFKLDSWKNWNLLSSNCFIVIFLSNGGHSLNDSQSFLIVEEEGNEYFGGFYDSKKDEPTEVNIDFNPDKSSGTIQVSKKIMNMNLNNLTFQFYTIVADNPNHYYDAAPDDQSFMDYVPGPNTEKPMLDVSTIDIQAGDIKKNDIAKVKFTIMNKGEGLIKVSLTASANIRLDTNEITLGEYETSEVNIFITANKLESNSYLETIDVKSDFGSYNINVSFYVLPEPKLEIDLPSIDFGNVILGEKKSKKIKIFNKVKGPIQVSLSTNDQWIILSKTTFESKSEDIIVSISTKTMVASLYEGKIKVTSNGGSAIIPVTVEVIHPLSLDKEEFDFGEINLDDPKTEPIPFTLTNQTDETITLRMTSSEPWISIGSEIKIESKESKELKVAIKLDKMGTINKSYEGTITFESKYDKMVIPVKAYLKQTPPKTLWVTDPPNQKLVEEKLITGKTWEKLFTIKNDGSGVMEVQGKLEDSKTEFRLFNTKLTLKKGETADIKIKFDSTGLKLGTYKNTLILESNGGNLTIPISIEVQPKPEVVIKLFIGLSFAYIDQEQIKLEASPYISKGTTMVPLRFISEAFKAKIEWFPIGKGRIIVSIPSKTIQLDIGESFAFINGDKLPLQAPPEIKSGRTFVPVRFIAEGLGAKIEWKADTQQITIYYVIEE